MYIDCEKGNSTFRNLVPKQFTVKYKGQSMMQWEYKRDLGVVNQRSFRWLSRHLGIVPSHVDPERSLVYRHKDSPGGTEDKLLHNETSRSIPLRVCVRIPWRERGPKFILIIDVIINKTQSASVWKLSVFVIPKMSHTRMELDETFQLFK